MNKRPTGGSAFPQANHDAYGMGPGTIDDTGIFDTQGMTLRDWFAGQALMNIHGTNPNLPDSPAALVSFPDPIELSTRQAKWAYIVADAMLKERSK